ncbi:N-acetylmuramoyl-L-alanine amidase [Kribbella rubisoli]|uniref:N-acetylmuramoyl-L-alanine amidase n=1 Tax=Kribbella rubisoli TaxID=3075929 RepID=A0A4V2FX45_9ACTN|nr:peptidoglycan recognition family protein [Kribbella rubisoli]RZU12286.1 N-acetylmuramoyl-L-alanine amidase [Kribbella rubisoli]
MVNYLPRSAWNARPPKDGPGNLTVSRVEGAVIHWPGTGSTKVIHTQAAVASALRGWQDYHMDSRGWSDIAYQVAVDQSGRAWTLRGLRTQSGANGDNDVNERYGAILLVLVTGEQPSAAMKATTRAVIADFRRLYPRGTAIRPHSAVRPEPTDCPGDPARAAIARGEFTPGNSEDDDMTPAQMQELKNFIEARSQAYALWVHKQLRRDLTAVVKAYALDIKNYERQTDAADAARAAAAVWATAPKSIQVDGDPAQEPVGPDPTTDPEPSLPDLDPFPTVDATPNGDKPA